MLLHKVLEIRNLSSSTYGLRLERKNFIFQPGQCVNLGTRGSGVNREYSTYSGTQDPYLEFLIKEVKAGALSPKLRLVRPGDEVELHGPYGSFTIDPEKANHDRFVFIGTGTGIAPFHSFVKSFPGLKYKLIHGIRNLSEQYDYDDFDPSNIACCVSRNSGGDFNGRVTGYLQQNSVDPENIFYLCGNQKMIQEVYDLLRNKGISGDQIFTEAFF
ncbi:hypothetical protein UR09_04570 [Candidatus Nitromaritima sp. SCGC AAA799-A02]|nr:hypothetical protein UR09_04570 [Candidatus Nitromaritima sp. SCGC AAA799-A02]